MPWTEMLFRGRDRVWVLTDDAGSPTLDQGRVTMKYKPEDAAKTYSAAASNVSAVGQGAVASTPKATSNPARATTFDELIWKKPAQAIVLAHDEPSEIQNIERPAAGVWEFHTDGACSGNPGRCGWGWVLRTNEVYLEANQYLGIGTNNIAELMAIKAALDHVDDPDATIRIHTDSNYSLGVITKDWKAKANVELVDTIRKRMRAFKRRPEIIKVKGHAGDPLNERADHLATSSIRS